jgi:hypothetical protein
MRFLLFFLLSFSAVFAVDRNVPGTYATVQLAVNAAQPGDTVVIAPGTYAESVSTARAGSPSSRITIDGLAAPSVTIRSMNIKHAYVTVKRATISGNTTKYGSQLYLSKGAHFTRIENCVIDGNDALKLYGINWDAPATKPFGTDAASDCVITSCTIKRVKAYPCVSMMGDRNIVENCTIGDGTQVDFFRLWGRNNIIRGNTFNNNAIDNTLGNHPDFIQTFGNNGFGSSGHIIERNIVGNALGAQLTQLEGNLLPDIRDWTFRNNIFHNIGLQASCTIPAVKYYNNVFYRCNIVNGGSALNFGTRYYEARSVDDSSPLLALIAFPIPSGSLVEGGNYKVYQNTATGGTVTYNGTVYGGGDTFDATSVLTYTKSAPAVTVMRRIPNHAHDTDIRGNVFLECGNGTWTKGWYSFSTVNTLTGIIADYNYVALAGYAPMRQGVAQYGEPGWDFQKFYEPHGINGGYPGMQDPASLNFVLHDGALLVDRSVSLTGLVNDFIGNARPYGGGFDIGAYENQSGVAPEGPPDPPVLLPAVINAATTTATSTAVTPAVETP